MDHSAAPLLVWRHPRIQERFKQPLHEQHGAAAALWTRLWQHRTRLCEPDAWLHLGRHELFFAPTRGTQALRPGDVLQYSQVFNLPFVTHDTVYVGKGFIAHLIRRKHAGFRTGFVLVERLDELTVRGREWQPVRTPVTLSPQERLGRVWRALSSTGVFDYNPVTFNCQHLVHLWLAPARCEIGRASCRERV